MASQGLYGSASSASPAQAASEPIIRFLVVCGASNKHDAWAFGNLVGFHRVITTLGGEGQFFNVFPIQEYFDSMTSNTTISCLDELLVLLSRSWTELDLILGTFTFCVVVTEHANFATQAAITGLSFGNVHVIMVGVFSLFTVHYLFHGLLLT